MASHGVVAPQMNHAEVRLADVRPARGGTLRVRSIGAGPGLVLLHAAMQSAHSLMVLARLLSTRFTVHVPDRRGRGASSGYADGHGLATEVDDLRAVLDGTGARYVFGLSAGAVIALETARVPGVIDALAVYEPPLSYDGVDVTAWVPAFERQLARGRTAAALVSAASGTGSARSWVPDPVRAVVLAPRLRRADVRAARIGVPGPAALVPTMHYDAITVGQAAGPLERFAEVTCPVLLLGGAKGTETARETLDRLALVLPDAGRVTLPGVGHLAADNQGRPGLVAAELDRFFTCPDR